MRYHAVIFDMDGTLLDTLEDLWESVEHTMDHFGYPSRSLAQVRAAVGNGASKLIERCLPAGGSDPRFADVLDFYRDYYSAHAQDKTRPYPGILALLERLRDEEVKTAVVSNKPDEAVRLLAERYFPGLLQVAVGQRPGWPVKPAPDAVRWAMEELGAVPETTVYVGDHEVDLATAQSSGLDCISVTWGFRDEAVLRAHGARALAHSADEMWALLS